MTEDPLFGDEALPESFWEKTLVAESGCWVWLGAITSSGYAHTKHEGKSRGAHTVAWDVLVGLDRTGMVLDHLCSNKPCINPAHLEPVSRRKNGYRTAHAARAAARLGVDIDDMCGNGRHKRPKRGGCKLCQEEHAIAERIRWEAWRDREVMISKGEDVSEISLWRMPVRYAVNWVWTQGRARHGEKWIGRRPLAEVMPELCDALAYLRLEEQEGTQLYKQVYAAAESCQALLLEWERDGVDLDNWELSPEAEQALAA